MLEMDSKAPIALPNLLFYPFFSFIHALYQAKRSLLLQIDMDLTEHPYPSRTSSLVEPRRISSSPFYHPTSQRHALTRIFSPTRRFDPNSFSRAFGVADARKSHCRRSGVTSSSTNQPTSPELTLWTDEQNTCSHPPLLPPSQAVGLHHSHPRISLMASHRLAHLSLFLHYPCNILARWNCGWSPKLRSAHS
ncbi:hypothetical protein K432DRAFT_80686 [Lepidopterella palustris CBS 459.81]|uniref:Uncharacterized protein n=1 Tax=Lepidopterella palustris CBS 459.81 TaxID=1314670 RepID=A0A8E2E7R0_9PEZI|nr:hypothetical protein K432DRAFT_80686 [Lepidopterella palustris CBS 459.81]